SPLSADRHPAVSLHMSRGVTYHLFPAATANSPDLVYVQRRRGRRETWYALQSLTLAQQVVHAVTLCNAIPSGVH
ncbi:MAG: hypothetical protein K6T31_04330, partial [Alicyclobacillus sp.]|nr:hypothetical protein [Alicyclobacillus sp.]